MGVNIQLEWDEDSIEHIWGHRVYPDEVEEVLKARHLLLRGRSNRRYALGQTEAGRYLFVVLAQRKSGRYRVETARDMNTSERRRFLRRMR